MKVQLVVVQRIDTSIWTEPGLKPGDVVWVDKDAARHLLEAGLCKWPEAPAETKTAAERKPLTRSPGWPMDRFAIVERAWEGETVVCIGGGPSLTAADLETVRGRARVIVVNDAYLLAPWADLCYFADARWWKWHSDGIAKSWPWVKFTADEVKKAFAAFAGQKVTIGNTGMMVADPAVYMLQNYGSDKLSEKPNGLHTGSNSGYQVINLAVLAGAKRILLLGYDMKYSGGRSHSHNGHPVKMAESCYSGYAKNFATMLPQLAASGVQVVNCTPGSAIGAFPFGDLATQLGGA